MRLVLFCVLLATPVHAGITVQQGDLRAGADVDRDSIKYVDQLQLTLWIEGPAPLEVTTPKPVLANANTWRVYEPGLPLREVLPNGRQRWQQTFRLSPLLANKVTIVPSPLRVRAAGQEATIDWDGAGLLQVTVIPSVDNPSADSLRPPADIEQLPAPPGVAESRDGYLFAIVPVCLVVAFVLVRWAKKKPKTVTITPDAAWVRSQLQGDVSPDVCAHALRAYVGYRLGSAVLARTTAELIAHLTSLQESPFTTDHVTRLETLLAICDQGRFSGQPTLGTLAPQALQWLDEVEASANLAVEVRRG